MVSLMDFGPVLGYDGFLGGPIDGSIEPFRQEVRGMKNSKSGRGLKVWGLRGSRADEVYERFVGDYLNRCTLGSNEDFSSAVAKRFRDASARACSVAIGAWVEQRLTDEGWTQQDLAERVGVDRSAVARWTAGGTLSLAHLVQVLIAFGAEVADLPWPARRELAVEAFIAALDYVRSQIEPERPGRGIDRDEFWCLYHLFAEPYWERAVRLADDTGLRQEALRIISHASSSLGHQPNRVLGVDGLRRLVEDWAAAWVVALRMVPEDWANR